MISQFIFIDTLRDVLMISVRGYLEPLKESEERELSWYLEQPYSQIIIFINSTGGNAKTACKIYSALKINSARKVVYINGIAASGASVITMSGDKIVMRENARMMIHRCRVTIFEGSSSFFMALGAELAKLDEIAIEAFCEVSGQSREVIVDLMEKQNWFGAHEALKFGLVHEIIQPLNAPPEELPAGPDPCDDCPHKKQEGVPQNEK